MSTSDRTRPEFKYERDLALNPETGFALRMFARHLPLFASGVVVVLGIALVLGSSFSLVSMAIAAVTALIVILLVFTIRYLFLGLADLVDYVRDLRDSSVRLEGLLTSLSTAPREPAVDQRATKLAEIRHAIRSQLWSDATDLLAEFSQAHPDDPESARAAADLAQAREEARRDLREKLASTREANDPDRAIELRDLLKPLLPHEELRTLDRDLAKWLMSLIQRRLRTGKVGADVANLAGKVAHSLDDTAEGASLRASLPTLRRAVGLCARCAQPYTGIEDACPNCLGGSIPSPTIPPPTRDNPENGRFPEILDSPT
jgi:hypothetical protein